jgi:hypothetical protein
VKSARARQRGERIHLSPYQGREAEIKAAVCEALKQGIPLAEVCREDGMPDTDTIYHWQDKDADFKRGFVRAREIGFDAIAADCLAIADETSRDTIETQNGEKPDAEWIARSRLRVETRLKLLAKWDPKRYGEKLDVTSGGESLVPREPIDQLRARVAEAARLAERN